MRAKIAKRWDMNLSEKRLYYSFSWNVVANEGSNGSLAWAELYLTTYAVFSRFNLQLSGTTRDDVTLYR